jgi:hypothetical protein
MTASLPRAMLPGRSQRGAPGASPWWTGCAFGLRLSADFAAPGLLSVFPCADTGEPGAAQLRLTTERAIAEVWHAEEASPLWHQRAPDGRVGMCIDSHPKAGFRIVREGYGTYLLPVGGRTVLVAPPRGPAWRWQRYLVGQALPLAALLQGLEALHASAVELGGGAVAFIGNSRGGKTSVALNLALRGAPFLADDVLAIDSAPSGAAVRAYPGAGLTSVRFAEAERVGLPRLRELGDILGKDDEAYRVAVRPAAGLRRHRALYFLKRSPGRPGVHLEVVAQPPPGLVLAGTFNFVLRTPERLSTQLETHALLARSVRIVRAHISEKASAGDVADAVAAFEATQPPSPREAV